MPASARIAGHTSLTLWSLAALAAGLALGLVAHVSGGGWPSSLASLVRPAGDLWVAALQATVLPLAVAHLLAAVIGAGERDSFGALGGRAVVLFVTMLAVAALFTMAIGPGVVALYPVNRETIAALSAATSVPESARAAAAAAPGSLGDWVAGLMPSNLLEAAMNGEILPLLLFSVALGMAVRRLPDDQREPLSRAITGLAAAMLIVVRWILWLTPLGVFAFIFLVTLGAGGAAAGILAAFVVIQSGAMLLVTALLYPVSALFGRTSLLAFARAVAPAQLVAVSTRSSLAALPALIGGARDQLRLPPAITGLALPLSTSLFKLNRTVSATIKLLFLAHIYGVSLPWGTLVAFVLTVILLSFTAVGVPGGGSTFKTMPAYLAAGIPIEGVVILEAADTIPDIFKTLLNVTGDMSAATLLSRSAFAARPVPSAEEPVPAVGAA